MVKIPSFFPPPLYLVGKEVQLPKRHLFSCKAASTGACRKLPKASHGRSTSSETQSLACVPVVSQPGQGGAFCSAPSLTDKLSPEKLPAVGETWVGVVRQTSQVARENLLEEKLCYYELASFCVSRIRQAHTHRLIPSPRSELEKWWQQSPSFQEQYSEILWVYGAQWLKIRV